MEVQQVELVVDDVDDNDADDPVKRDEEDEKDDDERPRGGDDDPAGERDEATADDRQPRGGEWDEALELAGLRPRAELHAERRGGATPTGMSPALAIHHFLEAHGVENGWPGKSTVKSFAQLAE